MNLVIQCEENAECMREAKWVLSWSWMTRNFEQSLRSFYTMKYESGDFKIKPFKTFHDLVLFGFEISHH